MTTPDDIVMSVDQPYASLIMLGVKRFETRPAPPNGDMRPDGVRGLPGARVNRGDRLLIASTARKPKVPSSYGLWWVDMHQHIGLYMDHEHDLTDIRLPLGCILGSVTVTDAYPIIEWPYTGADYPAIYDHHARVVHPPDADRDWVRWCRRNADGLRECSHHDEVALGDWTPGRWAWALTDPTPTTERCPWCDGAGWEPQAAPRTCSAGCGCRWLSDPERGDCACDGDCFGSAWDHLPDGSDRPDLTTCTLCDGVGSCGPIPVTGKQGVWRWQP